MAARYLDADEIVVPLNHMLFRRRDRATTLRYSESGTHNFHQDHDLIPAIFPLNFWLPLSTVDDETTGLSFAFPRSRDVYKLPLPIEQHLARPGGGIWTPATKPGDLLVFDRFTIHGGLFDATKSKPRLSVELRLGNARELGDYGDPVARI